MLCLAVNLDVNSAHKQLVGVLHDIGNSHQAPGGGAATSEGSRPLSRPTKSMQSVMLCQYSTCQLNNSKVQTCRFKNRKAHADQFDASKTPFCLGVVELWLYSTEKLILCLSTLVDVWSMDAEVCMESEQEMRNESEFHRISCWARL
eukprot:977146-Pelagomonas_calceolata.AAC.7